MTIETVFQPQTRRTAHPYFSYEAIRQQPERIAEVFRRERDNIARAAEAAAARKRLLLAGIGSSYHAALAGGSFLRHLTAGRLLAVVEQSFEFVHYPPAVSADDAAILISHRGVRNDSVRALQLLNAAGAYTIGVTGQGTNELAGAARLSIATCEPETAFAHTKSYTAALAALAGVCVGLAERRGLLANPAAARAALEGVAEDVRRALGCESAARVASREIARRERWIFIGAGPNWPTALEASLKAKEMSYFNAEGMETEQFLHGPQVEIDERACVTVFLSGSSADARGRQLLRACGELGALRVAVAARGVDAAGAEHMLEMPSVEEWLTPFVHVVGAQLLSYFTALERRANPDTGREDQPAHARARLQFD